MVWGARSFSSWGSCESENCSYGKALRIWVVSWNTKKDKVGLESLKHFETKSCRPPDSGFETWMFTSYTSSATGCAHHRVTQGDGKTDRHALSKLVMMVAIWWVCNGYVVSIATWCMATWWIVMVYQLWWLWRTIWLATAGWIKKSFTLKIRHIRDPPWIESSERSARLLSHPQLFCWKYCII